MAPLKVYGSPRSPFVARVMATLEEKGAEYELLPVNIFAGEHQQPPHTHRNPFGQVPAIEDGDLTLFESRAISRYVARKYRGTGEDLLRYENEKEAAMVEVWLEVESQQYNPVISPIIKQLFSVPAFGGKTDENIVSTNVEKLGKVLDVYEDKLKKTKYLAGDFFSLADLHHLPHTFYLTQTRYAELIDSRPHVKAWWEEITARPSVKKVTEAMARALAVVRAGAK